MHARIIVADQAAVVDVCVGDLVGELARHDPCVAEATHRRLPITDQPPRYSLGAWDAEAD
jgi:hypothetical protein